MSNCRTGEMKEEFTVYSLVLGKKITNSGLNLTVSEAIRTKTF